MPERTETGFLLAADISGYTEMLTASELEHAHEILKDLLRVLSAALKQPLKILKYEGDAVLCRAPDSDLGDASLLLELVEECYVAFSDRLFNIRTQTTCTCRACANSGRLDLKFFLHHGEYIVDDQGLGEDISGPDVILLHRLMKNEVSERFGFNAYVLATQAALTRLGDPPGFTAHTESYEHFGEVQCGVEDLVPILAARRDARNLRVSEEEATFICEAFVDASPMVVWDFFLDPERRLSWDHVISGMSMQRNGSGRLSQGSVMHCSHGDTMLYGTMVDWKPFDYYTQEFVAEGPQPIPPSTMTMETMQLEDGRTRLRQYLRFHVRNPIKRRMMKPVFQMIQSEGDKALAKLSSLASSANR